MKAAVLNDYDEPLEITDVEIDEPGPREVRLRTNRKRAPNGSALPRYTYFTVRTRTGESARILVQDTDAASLTGARRALGDAATRSFLVPDVVTPGEAGAWDELARYYQATYASAA